MPILWKRPGEKGDLIVCFVVDFQEKELTEEQNEHVGAVFSGLLFEV